MVLACGNRELLDDEGCLRQSDVALSASRARRAGGTAQCCQEHGLQGAERLVARVAMHKALTSTSNPGPLDESRDGFCVLHPSAVIAMARGCGLGQLSLEGVVGMVDPPREGVAEAIQYLHRTSVQVKVITGDARDTAVSVGEEGCVWRGGEKVGENAGMRGEDV